MSDTSAGPVLLVEDNPGDAGLVMDILAEHDGPTDRIVHVSTLAEAVRRLHEIEVEAIVLDLGLSDGVGVECVTTIRAHAHDVPIVVLTGTDDDALARSCIQAGAYDFLSKRQLLDGNLGRYVSYALTHARARYAQRRADAVQALLAAIVETSPDAIVSCDTDGIVTSWNHGATSILGYTATEAIGQRYRAVLRPPDREWERDQDVRIADLLNANRHESHAELVRLAKDGRAVSLSVVSTALRDGGGAVSGFASISRDITESKRRDEDLRVNNEALVERERQMRALTVRMDEIRETERTRISREVHDELGQLLTGLKMDLRWIGRRLSPADAVTSVIAPRLGEAETLVDRTIETVQRIAVELRPSALDALGLGAAIRDEARRFAKRTGVVTSVDILSTTQPDPATGTALFRMFQELLTNVARHACADRVEVSLDDHDNIWALRVEDDGVGVNRRLRRPSSLGLLGIQERTEALGGVVTVAPVGDRGTLAIIRIPRARQDR